MINGWIRQEAWDDFFGSERFGRQRSSKLTPQVKFKLPPTKEFDMPYPEPFKLAQGPQDSEGSVRMSKLWRAFQLDLKMMQDHISDLAISWESCLLQESIAGLAGEDLLHRLVHSIPSGSMFWGLEWKRSFQSAFGLPSTFRAPVWFRQRGPNRCDCSGCQARG